jgi:hypothetical protein
VVRSLVRTKDSSTHAVIGEFRNLHVFRKEGDAWMCVDWQVTELPTGEVPRAAADRLAVAKAYEDGKHRRYALLSLLRRVAVKQRIRATDLGK